MKCWKCPCKEKVMCLMENKTFNDDSDDDNSDDDDKQTEKKREVTPPPSIMPFDTKKSKKSPEKEHPIQPPPSLIPLEPEFLGPKKLDIKVNETDKVKIVTYPTDEDGKVGEKEYLVYKLLKDAFNYSPELPPAANIFTRKGFESVNFSYDSVKNRYQLTYDPEYVRGIHLSQGFSSALGFKQLIFNDNIATNPPKIENLHSHIHIYVNNVICPIFCGTNQESILDILPITPDANPISKTYERPNYLRIHLNSINTIEMEFKDIHGNPIIGDNATGHFTLEFVKFYKKNY
uniref:Uncharacterized protein n=1 Tax=Panagrolaimus superbus TaxID=310955 RepID=A0A914YFY4_9BILA